MQADLAPHGYLVEGRTMSVTGLTRRILLLAGLPPSRWLFSGFGPRRLCRADTSLSTIGHYVFRYRFSGLFSSRRSCAQRGGGLLSVAGLLPPPPRPTSQCRWITGALPARCSRIPFVLSSCFPAFMCFHGFSVPVRPPDWLPAPLYRTGTRALVNCISARFSQPFTCCHVRMNTRVSGGGTPNFLVYGRIMSLQPLTGAGSSPRKR